MNRFEMDIDLTVELREIVETPDVDRLNGWFAQLPIAEALRELLELSPEERSVILTLAPAETAAELI